MRDLWADFPDVPAIIAKQREYAREHRRADWFGPDEMRFFGTRCESPVIAGCLFITSETDGTGRRPRAYAVRRALPDGQIDTVWHGPGPGVCVHRTLADAVVYAVAYALSQGWAPRDVHAEALLHRDDTVHPNRAAVAAIVDGYGTGFHATGRVH